MTFRTSSSTTPYYQDVARNPLAANAAVRLAAITAKLNFHRGCFLPGNTISNPTDTYAKSAIVVATIIASRMNIQDLPSQPSINDMGALIAQDVAHNHPDDDGSILLENLIAVALDSGIILPDQLGYLAKAAQLSDMVKLATLAKTLGCIEVNEISTFANCSEITHASTDQLILFIASVAQDSHQLGQLAKHFGVADINNLVKLAKIYNIIHNPYNLAQLLLGAEISQASTLAEFCQQVELTTPFKSGRFAAYLAIDIDTQVELAKKLPFANIQASLLVYMSQTRHAPPELILMAQKLGVDSTPNNLIWLARQHNKHHDSLYMAKLATSAGIQSPSALGKFFQQTGIYNPQQTAQFAYHAGVRSASDLGKFCLNSGIVILTQLANICVQFINIMMIHNPQEVQHYYPQAQLDIPLIDFVLETRINGENNRIQFINNLGQLPITPQQIEKITTFKGYSKPK